MDFTIAFRQTLVELAQIPFNACRFINDEYHVAEMFEDVRRGVHHDRHQPFPTRKRLAFVGEGCAITQRARKTRVAPALPCGLTPELEVNWRDGELVHW